MCVCLCMCVNAAYLEAKLSLHIAIVVMLDPPNQMLIV